MNELKDPITLHQQLQQKDKEKVELGTKIEQLQTPMEQIRNGVNVRDAEIKRLKSKIEKFQ